MIYTSYFAKVMRHPLVLSKTIEPISIANTQPPGMDIFKENILVPDINLVVDLKNKRITEYKFSLEYTASLEHRITDFNFWSNFLNNTVLVCWEAPDKFCHRRILAEWYRQKTGIEIPELQFQETQTELFIPETEKHGKYE